MATKKTKRRGPASLFHDKIRKPVSLTLTPAHHRRVLSNRQRLGISRADLIGLLIEKYADTVTKTYPDAYKRLRDSVEALGGTLEHRKRNAPRGGTWILTLGRKCLPMQSEQSERYPTLDACYRLKDGIVVSHTWNDHTDEINPSGLVELFRLLASTEDSGTQ